MGPVRARQHRPARPDRLRRLHERRALTAVDLARARAPHDARLYESHYLTAVDPSGGRALWLRHTSLHGRPSVWATWFDPEPTAARLELDEPLPRTDWPSCTLATFGPSSARGSLAGTSWDLEWDALAPPLPYLPSDRLYDKAFPRSSGAAVVPHALVSGRYGETELEAWPAVVGHNWGREHAEQWCWLHAPLPGGWVDLVLVRVRVGPLLLPWTAGGGASVDGTLRRTRPGRVRVHADGRRTTAEVPLHGGRVRLEVTAGPEVHWDYASPHGTGRQVRNSSTADLVATLPDGRVLRAAGTAAVEHGRPA